MFKFEVESLLLKGEEVISEWSTINWDYIYATQHRLFFVRDTLLDRKYLDVSYDHISSLEYTTKREISYLAMSIFFSIISLVLYLVRDYLLFIHRFLQNLIVIQTLIAILLIALFFKGKSVLIIHIVGRKPIELREGLPQLYKITRVWKNLNSKSNA